MRALLLAVFLLLLPGPGRAVAEGSRAEALDYHAWSFAADWPVASVELDEVPRTWLNGKGTKARYAGAATAYWRDGTTSRLSVSWTVSARPDRPRRDRIVVRSHPDEIRAAGGAKKLIPFVRIDLRQRDGVVVRAKGRFRQAGVSGGRKTTRKKGAAEAVPATPEPGFSVASGNCALVIDAEGHVSSLKVLPDGTELANPEAATELLEFERDGATVPLRSVFRRGGELVALFDAPGARVRLAVESADGHLLFRIVDAGSPEPDVLRLNVNLPFLAVVDGALNGTYDDESAVCLRPVTENARGVLAAAKGAATYTVEWLRRRGIAGGAAALVATPRPRFFGALAELEVERDLTSVRFDGVWARESEIVRESYLFVTYLGLDDIDALIEYAKVAGLRRILFVRSVWLKSAGTYGIDAGEFPGGLTEFVAACERIRAAGLGVGIHLYGPSVALNDPIVTPTPDRRLLEFACPSLAQPIGPTDARVELVAEPDLPAPGAGTFPGSYVRIDDEIIRYSGRSAEPPFAFTGCERGALGTIASAHAEAADVGHLATMWGQFLLDPDGGLVADVARNLARVVNAARIDMVYLDGLGGLPSSRHHDEWYYANRTVPAMYAAFDHPVLVQTSMGPGRDLLWHVVPRSASADGHGDLTYYLDRRTPAIESMRRGFTAPDVGWYGFDDGRPPDQLEYVAAKCLGWDSSLSMQTHRPALERHARARETMEMVGRYERFRGEGGLPEEVKEALLEPAAHFRLLTDADERWHLFSAAYEGVRDARVLTDGRHSWRVFNTAAAETTLGVEIVRGDAIHVDAELAAEGNIFVADFRDASAYAPSAENDFARLVSRVDKVVTENGAARRGVQHDFVAIDDPSVGGLRGALRASNGNNTIGWCAVGKRFASALDLSTTRALGVFLRGDGSGVSVSLELWDDAGNRVTLRAPMHEDGWRLHTFAFSPSANFDSSAVRYLVLIASDLPPGRDVEVGFAALRATPQVRPATSVRGARIRVDGRVVELPADLPPGSSVRIDALGRMSRWTGGMAAGTASWLPGGPLSLAQGAYDISLEVDEPDAYAGDFTIRLSHLEPVYSR